MAIAKKRKIIENFLIANYNSLVTHLCLYQIPKKWEFKAKDSYDYSRSKINHDTDNHFAINSDL